MTQVKPKVIVALTRPVLAALLAPGRAAEFEELAQHVEAVADAVILGADVAGEESAEESDAPGVDATVAATILAHHTTRLGLTIAVAPHRDHPYNIARRTASIDHASGGRVGIIVAGVDSVAPIGSPWTAAEPAVAADDAVIALRELWRSFPVDAIVGNKDSGVFAESHRIRAVDHVGPAFAVTGPLQVPWTPQIWPPVFAWSPSVTDTSPSTTADIVLAPDDPAYAIVRPVDVDGLRAWLGGAEPLGVDQGSGSTLRDRFGLDPAAPPEGGRQVFPDPEAFGVSAPAEAADVR